MKGTKILAGQGYVFYCLGSGRNTQSGKSFYGCHLDVVAPTVSMYRFFNVRGLFLGAGGGDKIHAHSSVA